MLQSIFLHRVDQWVFVALVVVCLFWADRRVLRKTFAVDQRGSDVRGPRRRRLVCSAVTLCLLVMSIVCANLVMEHQRSQLRSSVEGLAPTYAWEMESHGHAQITTQTAADDPVYLEMIEMQTMWLQLNPTVNDIYTMRLATDGVPRLIVDSETDYNRSGAYEGEREQRTAIGETYAEATPLMLAAFQGNCAFDDHPYSDRWGTWVSCYSPIYDAAGKIEAIVGVDFAAANWIRALLFARSATLGIGLAITLGYLGSSSVATLLRADLEERSAVAQQLRLQADSLAEANRELAVARDVAQTASQSKSEFLANMSHEIRTPMNGIIGLTEIVLKTNLNADQRRNLELVQSSADALMTVLNDILDFSKIEANKLTLDPHPFDLRDMIGDAMKLFGLRAHQRSLELAFRVPADIPNLLVADAGRIRQVLVNLVGNAIKFTPQGEIVVEVAKRAAEGEELVLEFSVRDTGIGIPPEKLAKVFEPFSQADGSTTRKYGGTGLGLTICSRLVSMMGGTITMESQEGQGTTVRFSVVCQVGDEEAAAEMELGNVLLDNVRMLVVDDNSTNRLILAEILESWQVNCGVAESGRDAVAMLQAAEAAGQSYQMVLMDVQMPELDGFDTARLIRQSERIQDVLIVMLSSSDASNYVAQCQELNMGAYLTKPLKQSELLETCVDVLKRKSRAPDCAHHDVTPRKKTSPEYRLSRPVRILLAEDNFVNQQLMLRVLQKDGHEVLLANHGGEAVEILGRESVDIVLMDVQMPCLDGYEATAAIRAVGHKARAGQTLPIIALTANAMKGDREKCLDAGMDDYVTKPIVFATLYATMDKYLMAVAEPEANATTVETAECQPESSVSSVAVSESPSEPCALSDASQPAESTALDERSNLEPVLDRDGLLVRVDHDLELIEILASAFERDATQHLESILRSVEEGDWAKTKKIAHTLKGTAGNMGGTQMVKLCKQIELAAQAGDGDELAPLLESLRQTFDCLNQALRDLAGSEQVASESAQT